MKSSHSNKKKQTFEHWKEKWKEPYKPLSPLNEATNNLIHISKKKKNCSCPFVVVWAVRLLITSAYWKSIGRHLNGSLNKRHRIGANGLSTVLKTVKPVVCHIADIIVIIGTARHQSFGSCNTFFAMAFSYLVSFNNFFCRVEICFSLFFYVSN